MQVRLTTSKGQITLELNQDKAPKTSENFLTYVRDGFYAGTLFHRVIDGFMIQGGGFQPGMVQKPTRETIQNEADNGLSNETGTIAMARTQDPHSASAQFFVNTNDNDFLDFKSATQQGWGYCVFGKVIDGMEVVTEIEECATGAKSGHKDVPVDDIVIERAEIVDD